MEMYTANMRVTSMASTRTRLPFHIWLTFGYFCGGRGDVCKGLPVTSDSARTVPSSLQRQMETYRRFLAEFDSLMFFEVVESLFINYTY